MKAVVATRVDQYWYCPRHGIPVLAHSACKDCASDKPDVDPSRRLNVGCGQWPRLYWTNLDADPSAIADIYQRVPPLPYADAALDDIYAGHFLEHLTPDEASDFLAECLRCLVPGGRLGVVVPDTREIVMRWLNGANDLIPYDGHVYPIADLNAVCALFLYSTVQDSQHRWSYDTGTLRALLEHAGFSVTDAIDRWRDPRIPVGAWYQCGWDAVKP